MKTLSICSENYQRKILSELSREELIERNLELIDKKERQAKKLSELEAAIIGKNKDINYLEKSIVSLKDDLRDIIQGKEIEKKERPKEVNKFIKSYKKKNKEIEELKESFKAVSNTSKLRELNKHYEDLLRDYRLEISDLKDEVENWKGLYKKLLKIKKNAK